MNHLDLFVKLGDEISSRKISSCVIIILLYLILAVKCSVFYKTIHDLLYKGIFHENCYIFTSLWIVMKLSIAVPPRDVSSVVFVIPGIDYTGHILGQKLFLCPQELPSLYRLPPTITTAVSSSVRNPRWCLPKTWIHSWNFVLEQNVVYYFTFTAW